MSHTIATDIQNTKYKIKITGMLATKEQSYLKDLKMINGLLPESGQYNSRPGQKSSSKLAFFWIDKQNCAETAIAVGSFY